MVAQAAVSIPGVRKERFQVTIEGDTSLITNKFSDRAKKSILDKQMKKAQAARAAKDPEANYQGSIYRTEDGRPGFPASGIKKACVEACRFLEMAMTEARGAFFVMGDILPIEGEPRIREDIVRLGGRTADIRYRAEFPEWRIELTVLHNPDVISAESIVNLIETAGFHIGIGDWRPTKSGTHGMFHVSKKEN